VFNYGLEELDETFLKHCHSGLDILALPYSLLIYQHGGKPVCKVFEDICNLVELIKIVRCSLAKN
jgi:hypothetical protein